MNLRDEIQDELKQVAPQLASLPRSHPFKIPSIYFEEMETKLISAIKEERNDKAILPGLNEHPFHVPDNYFSELPSTILAHVKSEELSDKEIRATTSITKKISDNKLWLAAASIAIVMVVSASLFMKHSSTQIASDKITTEGLASDLLYASQVDEALVVELYLQEQQKNGVSGSDNDDTNFLRDVTDIDPNSITGM